ncbi:unnamed protein product [Allacma fusca]|uniref:Uncharacterized protein n=1 Tax=Allacma fusca TaxID=39272 RepID=A0A8J2LH78_9HEXA|nr:unnamed protein product [Allacma fusca]
MQMSSKPMEDLLLKLDRKSTESFSSFYCHIQHQELNLAHSPNDKTWKSFFVCVLLQLFHCPGYDNLEDIVEPASNESRARLYVKINEIIRCSSQIFKKTITCEEISKTIQNRAKGIQYYIKDFLIFLNDTSIVVLETRKAEQYDQLFKWDEQEEDLQSQNNQLEREHKNAEEQLPSNITINENRNDILEVTGKHLLVSDVLKSIKGYSFKELRLVAGLTIFLDADFPQDRFHGKNVVMSALNIEVIRKVTINTSGHSVCRFKCLKAPNGFNSGRNGTDGEDGAAGESAGHVYLLTSKWESSQNLTIIANGGNGGFGQDGGDGSDGGPGRNGVDGNADENWKKQKGRNKYIHRGTKGERGDKGGDGGAGGRGGQGGYDGVDHGCAWHNYSFMFGEWRYSRGELGVKKQNVWYGGNGWELITLRSENEVKSCRADNGINGITGKHFSVRARRRNTTVTQNKISKNEILAMSKDVRTRFNRREITTLSIETAALNSDQALREELSILENIKLHEMTAKGEIAERLEQYKKRIIDGEDLQAKTKSEMSGTKRRQEVVSHNLKKVVSEKERLRSIINTTQGFVNQLRKICLQARLKFQNQPKQQIQATLTKEFDGMSLEPETTKQVISEDNQINPDTLIAQYKDIQNLMELPDEVLPVILGSRFSNRDSARAFQEALQTVISKQHLSDAAKGFVIKIFKHFQSYKAATAYDISKTTSQQI